MKTVAGPEPYILKRSRRKTLSLIIRSDGMLEIRSPLRLNQSQIDDFIQQKSRWIRQKRQQRLEQMTIEIPQPDEYPLLRVRTAELTEQLMSRFLQFRPVRVSIGRQRKRWGSCNSKGHIRINACLALLPEPLAEYVIVHELCHLVHLNHSSRFHALLQQTLPDARLRQQALSRYHLSESSPKGQQHD